MKMYNISYKPVSSGRGFFKSSATLTSAGEPSHKTNIVVDLSFGKSGVATANHLTFFIFPLWIN